LVFSPCSYGYSFIGAVRSLKIRNAHITSVGKPLGIDGRIILKWILKILGVRM
jgi:hypothetical protein